MKLLSKPTLSVEQLSIGNNYIAGRHSWNDVLIESAGLQLTERVNYDDGHTTLSGVVVERISPTVVKCQVEHCQQIV